MRREERREEKKKRDTVPSGQAPDGAADGDMPLFTWSPTAKQQSAFETWAAENPAILSMFERFALEAISTGLEHYSAYAVLHRVRWETMVAERSSVFKCNNNWTPFLSRWFAMKHPQHADFFRVRHAEADREPSLKGDQP